MVTPIHDRYVITPHEQQSIHNGIIIPEIAQQESRWGNVRHMSQKLENGRLKIGDVVMFSPYGATIATIENEKLAFVRERDIMAIHKDGKIMPMGDRFLIEIIPEPDKIGNIFIPPSSQMPARKAIIRKRSLSMRKDEVSVGTLVLFSSYALNPVPEAGQNMGIIRAHDVISIIE